MAKAKKAAPKKKAPPTKKKVTAPKKSRASSNVINEEDRALFLHHLPLIAKGRDTVAKATNALRVLYKTAKSEGFLKVDFDDAFLMQGAEGQKKAKATIARRLTIAKYLGLEMGENLDMFLDTEAGQKESSERSYDVGELDAMEGKTADATGFDEQKYMEGYHAATEKRIKKGIAEAPAKGSRKVDPAVAEAAHRAEEAAKQAKIAKQRIADEAAFGSGTPMTRAQFNAMEAAKVQQSQPQSLVDQSMADDVEEDEDDNTSMFAKR